MNLLLAQKCLKPLSFGLLVTVPLQVPPQNSMKVLVAQLCPTLCDPTDCGSPGSSDHGILQARILEWVAISSSRGSSWPRDQAQDSCHLLHWQADSLPLSHPRCQRDKVLKYYSDPSWSDSAVLNINRMVLSTHILHETQYPHQYVKFQGLTLSPCPSFNLNLRFPRGPPPYSGPT